MNNQLESGYKKDWVKAVKKAGGYARRIEDQYGVGILDTVIKLPELPVVFVEAKRFTGNQFKPRDRQWVEMDLIEKAGGKSCLIGVKDDMCYFSKITKLARVEDCVIQNDGETFCDAFRRWYKEQGQ